MNTASSGSGRIDRAKALPSGEFRTKLIKITEHVQICGRTRHRRKRSARERGGREGPGIPTRGGRLNRLAAGEPRGCGCWGATESISIMRRCWSGLTTQKMSLGQKGKPEEAPSSASGGCGPRSRQTLRDVSRPSSSERLRPTASLPLTGAVQISGHKNMFDMVESFDTVGDIEMIEHGTKRRLRITDIVKATGLSNTTLIRYEEEGKLPRAKRGRPQMANLHSE